ncbi:hypothetical protein APX70_02371 [Pseudomonas syringae pv. maculicola]|uniref:Uncharacterized protein n=1 Tax=Pseudomonas syringae pv. maculicola TaxID=59511 RepID=A0A3M3AHM9_PSEYM|nr:hypothetical protein APX70_02371 [Pseudomonas syringae pv. maculicola]
MHRHAIGDLFTDPREDQHVGIHRHTHGQHDTGDTRQGQCGTQQGHQRQQHDHVQGQGNGSDQTEEAVDRHDEDGYEQHAPQGSVDTLGDVVGTQARTDGALFSEVHRRGQTTRAQQQRQLGRLTLTIQTGNPELTAQRRLDGRQADDFLFFLEGLHRHVFFDAVDHLPGVGGGRTLLDEDHRHAATHIAAGCATHQFATVTIKVDVHLWTAVLVETGLGVSHLVAGDDQTTLHCRCRTSAFAEFEHFGGALRIIRACAQTELEVGGLAQNTLGFGRVLHTRQLDHDAVGTLTLNQRLGNTQLIDPVTDGGQVLLDRVFTNLGQFGRGQRHAQYGNTVQLGRRDFEIGEGLAHQCTSLLALCIIGKAQLNHVAQLRQAAITRLFLAQQGFDFAFVDFQTRIDRLVHVDFQQEVHTTGQVETELHRACAQVAQPGRRGARQVQCDDIVITQRLAHDILGW